MHAAPILTTDRLILRGWRESDFAALTAMMADPDVARYLTVDGRPPDNVQTWRSMAVFVGHWALRGYGLFAVEERATGAFVGRVGPWRPEGWPGFEIGWGLARAYWGRGYATEAARAAGDWAFAAFGLENVISLIHVDNVASQAVARRLGERPQSATMHAGQPHTIWSATRAEWTRA